MKPNRAAEKREAEEAVALVRATLAAHDAEWDARKPMMRKFRDLYGSRFWLGADPPDGNIQVETGDAPNHVDSYVAGLFSRAPAVEIGKDEGRLDADPRACQAAVNRWLPKQRKPMIHAVRKALLYPCAFVRVSPGSTIHPVDPVDAPEVTACNPWDVVIDAGACDWAHMRWVAHRYPVPVAVAKQRWPDASFPNPAPEARFFDDRADRRSRKDEPAIPADLKLVTVVEFYDLVRGRLIFWSPDYDKGQSALTIAEIPLRWPGTQIPVAPIAPLYFAEEPDQPLVGIPTISRLYDQFREKNIMRTAQANAVRRDARTWVYDKIRLGEEDLSSLAAGIDGAMVGINGPVTGAIEPVPNAPLSSNFTTYQRAVDEDITKGAALAAFSRGEPVGGRATAAEIGALAGGSASTLGRMAAERDDMIQLVAMLYLATRIADGSPSTVLVDGVLAPVEAEYLDQQWRISALDQAGTPVSRAFEQQRFQNLLNVPIFTALFTREGLVAEMLRLDIISPRLAAAMLPPPPPAPPAPPAGAPLAPDPAATAAPIP